MKASLVGRVLGPYRIDCLLGNGDTGQVYRAVRLETGDPAALKILNAGSAMEASAARRNQHEARLQARLEHPNLVRFEDEGVAGGLPYIAHELVDGCSLRALLQRVAPVSPPLAVRIARDLASALAYLHAQGVVHGDLNPAHALLHRDGTVKLNGAGQSRDLTSMSTIKANEMLRITRCPAPETVNGQKPDTASDVYALGLVMYQLLTGRLPFPAASPAEWARMVVQAEPAPIVSEDVITQKLSDLVANMLSRDSAARPTCDAALSILDHMAVESAKEPLRELVNLVALEIVQEESSRQAPGRKRSFLRERFEALGRWTRAIVVVLSAIGFGMFALLLLIVLPILLGETPLKMGASIRNGELVLDITRSMTQDQLRDFFQETLRNAKRGDRYAVWRVGALYYSGQGVAKNEALGVQWLERGARDNMRWAAFSLGWIYQNGRGVPRDPAAALRYFRQAAGSGEALYQLHLGELLYRGSSIGHNPVEGRRWLNKAAAHGMLFQYQVNSILSH